MEAARALGFEMNMNQALELRSLEHGLSQKRFREWFGEEADIELVRMKREELMEGLSIEAKPGAREVGRFLQERNIPYCVCTASSLDRAKDYLSKAGLLDIFPRIVSAKESSRENPTQTHIYWLVSVWESRPMKRSAWKIDKWF